MKTLKRLIDRIRDAARSLTEPRPAPVPVPVTVPVRNRPIRRG